MNKKDNLVYDVDRDPLRLLKTRLVETQKAYRWTVTFAEIRRVVKNHITGNDAIRIERRLSDNRESMCGLDLYTDIIGAFDPLSYQIGCRAFSKRSFNKILKAAGAK